MPKLEKIRHKLTERWIKLLKAEAQHKDKKVRKHEVKLIKLELEERQVKDGRI